MFDLGQSDLKSHKSMSLSGVFRKAGEVCSFGGSLAGSSVAVRPSSSFDYISNTVSPRAALSSQNTMSQIKSNQIYSVSCFHKNKFVTKCLVRRQKYRTNPLKKQEEVKHNHSLQGETLKTQWHCLKLL